MQRQISTEIKKSPKTSTNYPTTHGSSNFDAACVQPPCVPMVHSRHPHHAWSVIGARNTSSRAPQDQMIVWLKHFWAPWLLHKAFPPKQASRTEFWRLKQSHSQLQSCGSTPAGTFFKFAGWRSARESHWLCVTAALSSIHGHWHWHYPLNNQSGTRSVLQRQEGSNTSTDPNLVTGKTWWGSAYPMWLSTCFMNCIFMFLQSCCCFSLQVRLFNSRAF